MANWGLPVTTGTFANVLSELKDRDVSLAKMFDGTSETSLPSGAIGYDTASERIRKWNGSTWANALPWIDSHVNSTSNPHSTTAAQVGAPTTTDFNNHTSNTSNPHSVTAAQVGAPTTAAFNSHTGNTSNPHSTTAAQVGACATANNLSELSATASTARTNIGAAAASDLSSHTGNTSNPHNVTRAQIGAAQSGTNGDITSLTNVTGSIVNPSNSLQLGTTSIAHFLFNFGGSTRFRLEPSVWCPTGSAHGNADIGTSSQLWKDIYFGGKLRRSTGQGTWSFFGGQPVSISSIDSELSFSGFDSNAQALLRAAARGVNQIAKWCVDHGLAN